jgi:hypothetical protein
MARVIRGVLNSIPTWPLLIGVVLLAVVAAIAGVSVLRRWHGSATDAHNDVLAAVLGAAGTLYAIILGFVLVGSYSDLKTTEDAVLDEATQITQIYRDTVGLPGLQDTIRPELHQYLHAVVETEWKTMSDGTASVETDAELDHIFAVFHAFRPGNDTDIAFYEEAIVKLNDVVSSRRVRLDAAMEEMPPDLLVLLIGGGIVLVSLTLLFGVANFRLHAVMVASVAGLMAFSVMLAIVLDYPFSGALSVRPDVFQRGELAQFWDR